MTVHVRTEPLGAFIASEVCAFCKRPTRTWWANGCMAVCRGCATAVTRQECIDKAKAEGFGPLPSQQYRKGKS